VPIEEIAKAVCGGDRPFDGAEDLRWRELLMKGQR
jgi:hypothetical protein